MPPLIPHFSALAADYDLILCDIWGVVHNGLAASPAACDALMRARAKGASVVFITNSPRPSAPASQSRPGQALFHLGPERDVSVFAGLDLRFAPLDAADYVVCTGLIDDETETPQDYRATLDRMMARKLFMLCGNPDMVVERGDKLVYCAGSLADMYRAMGGEVLYAGKPYRPIYEMALELAKAAAGRDVGLGRVLAIGDSVRTDFKGARTFGVDFLFITSGIHAEEVGGRERPDTTALGSVFAAAGGTPKAVMRQLMW